MKECPSCGHCFRDDFNNCPTDGAELTPSIAGEPVLDGRYQLERRLGHGGMGIVFKARHIFLKTSYAIKVILPDLVGNDPMLVTRFRQEAMVSARIGHPNIVNVTDFGVVGGKMPYLVMDLIKGKSLHDILGAQGHLEPADALEVMAGICAGVRAAHRQGIIHRDLKPLNVMLQDARLVSEAVKVLDFGLAKIKSAELLGSFVGAQTTGLMGSPYYMAPEQWSDEELDTGADIYSLGVILFQMLTGDVPFKGPSLPAIMKKHLSDAPPGFVTRGVHVSLPIEAVVRRALAKKRQDRMSSVDEFIDDLRAAVMTPDQAVRRVPSQPIPDTSAETMPFLDVTRGPVGVDSAADVSPDTQSLTESQRRIEDEADRLAREFEEAQRRADEARQRAEEAARKRAEEEAARRRAEEEAARKVAQEEDARRHAEDLARKRAEEEAERTRIEEETVRKAAEEQARQRAEEEAARKRAAEEAVRLAKEVVEAQGRAEEARLRADEEARKRTEEAVGRKRAEEKAQRLELEVAEAQGRAEEARLRAEQELRKRAEEEELRKRLEKDEERTRADELARIHAEDEQARKRAAEDAERLAREVSEAQHRADEARNRAEEEARKRVEAEEARQRAEEEAQKLSLQVAEAQRRAEESRKRAEEERRERAASDARAREEQIRREREQHVSEVPPTVEVVPIPESAGDGHSITEETVWHRDSMRDAASTPDQDWPIAGDAAFADSSTRRLKTLLLVSLAAVIAAVSIGGAALFYSKRWSVAKPTQEPAPVAPAKPTVQQPVIPKHEMAKIDGGTFEMGRSDINLSSKLLFDHSQYPAHTVHVNTFWMDKTEVTNSEYADFVRLAKYSPPAHWSDGLPPQGQDQWPVTRVSFSDVQAFADWRSKRDGRKYRLPTEEEWEYAARNGSQDTLYPWGNAWLDDRANVNNVSLTDVGSYPQGASRWGVLDLIGNAWEWTSSKSAPYSGNTTADIPQGQIIIRGGSYSEDASGPQAITATRRSWLAPASREPDTGFRLVSEKP